MTRYWCSIKGIAKWACPQWLKICLFGLGWGFPSGSRGKESACNAGNPGAGRSLEQGMATHSSRLAWEIPWTDEPGGLQFRGSHTAGLD